MTAAALGLMSAHDLRIAILGALAVTSGIVAVFFARYWALTRDRFYALFAAAFVTLGLNWGSIAAVSPESEVTRYAYAVRLAAFVLIIVAIIDKNRRAP